MGYGNSSDRPGHKKSPALHRTKQNSVVPPKFMKLRLFNIKSTSMHSFPDNGRYSVFDYCGLTPGSPKPLMGDSQTVPWRRLQHLRPLWTAAVRLAFPIIAFEIKQYDNSQFLFCQEFTGQILWKEPSFLSCFPRYGKDCAQY